METLGLKKTSEGLFLNERLWNPRLGSYEAFCLGQVDGVVLRVEADTHASLNFSNLYDQAQAIEEKQGWIWWEVDLGLFQGLKQPLSFKEQFQALAFSVEYIDKQLFKNFETCSIGFCLFSGSLYTPSTYHKEMEEGWQQWLSSRYPGDIDKSLNLKEASQVSWGRYEQKQFFHFLHLDYLHRLLSFCTTSLQAYLIFDLSSLTDFSEKLLHCHPGSFEHFSLVFKKHPHLELDKHLSHFVLDPPCLLKTCATARDKAFCLPALKSLLYPQKQLIDKAHIKLSSLAPHYRVICENNLIYEWEALDELWVIPSMVGASCQRALKGFEAAGGKVHFLDDQVS